MHSNTEKTGIINSHTQGNEMDTVITQWRNKDAVSVWFLGSGVTLTCTLLHVFSAN